MVSEPKGREPQHRCFLSHSTEHKDHAKFLKHEIENACAVKVFVASDPSSLSPGQDWYAELLANLKESMVTLVLMSPSSVNRPWLLFESGAAVGFGRTLIPLLFGGLRDTLLPDAIKPRHACDLSKRDSVIAMLEKLPSTRDLQMVSLNKRAESIVEHFRRVKEKQAETAATGRLPSLQTGITVLSTASETQRKLFFYVRAHESEGKKKGVSSHAYVKNCLLPTDTMSAMEVPVETGVNPKVYRFQSQNIISGCATCITWASWKWKNFRSLKIDGPLTLKFARG